MLNFYLNKNKIFKTSKFLLIFVLIAGWMFSGWPQVWPLGGLGTGKIQIPSEIQEARADNETLYVDGCTGTKTQWETMTNTPYLDDSDSSLIHEDKTASMEVGYFSFANTATDKTGTINSVILYFECRADDGPSDDGFDVYINDGGGWTNEGNVAPTAKGSYGWDTLDVSAKLDTWTKIDAATMYLDTINITRGDDRYVRRAYLYVDYSVISTTFLIGGSESGTKDTAVTTITFPESAPESTICAPYNNVDGSGDSQVLSATVSEPIVHIKNTHAIATYNITLEITTWTNSIASMEYYNLVADDAVNIEAVTSELSNASGVARSVATGVSIDAGTYKDLYLKLILGSVAGKTGTSTITILGETP